MNGSLWIVLIVLVVVYGVVALVLSLSALWLRRRAPNAARKLHEMQSLAPLIQERLNNVVSKLQQPIDEPPYAALYQQAASFAQRAQDAHAQAFQRLGRSEVINLHQQPLWRALMIVPVLSEVIQRVRWERLIKAAAHLLRDVQHSIDQIDITLRHIEGLPDEERQALSAASQRVAELRQVLRSEVRTKLTLDAEMQLVEQVTQDVASARAYLDADSITPEAVITAHRMRRTVEERINDLFARAEAIQTQRVEAAQVVRQAENALEQLKLRVEADEASGIPRPRFRAQLSASLDGLNAAIAALDAGEYEAAQTQSRSLIAEAKSHTQTLESLERARVSLSMSVDKATARLNTLEDWIAEMRESVAPDALEQYRNQFRETLDQMRAALNAEDVAILESAMEQKHALDRLFNAADRSRSETIALLHERSQHLRVLNHESVSTMVALAEQRAKDLSGLHERYQQPVTPSQLLQQSAELKMMWDRLVGEIAATKQSTLPGLVQSLDEARAVLDTLRRDVQSADQQLAQADQQRQRADQLLHSSESAQLQQKLAEVATLGKAFEMDVKALLDQRADLLAAYGQAAPDFYQIAADSEQWLNRANHLLAQYDAEHRKAQIELQACVRAIEGASAALDSLDAEQGFNFRARVNLLIQRARDWLASATPTQGLDATRACVSSGVMLQAELDGALHTLRLEARSLNRQHASAQEKLAELSGVIAAVRAGLESGALTALGSAQWGASYLAMLEQRAQALQQQFARFAQRADTAPFLPPTDFEVEVNRMSQDVLAAMQEAERLRLEVAEMKARATARLKEVKEGRQVALAFVQQHPEAAEEWSQLESWLNHAESRFSQSRRWEEAMALLDETLERLRRFRSAYQ